MTSSTPTIRHSETAQMPQMFLSWYWLERPRAILALYGRYASALSESFALKFMLKTLFSPWKSITDSYPSKGFSLQKILETFFLNITSRFIGLVVRLLAIIVGIIIQCALFAGFLAYALLWIFFPVVVLASIVGLLFF